MIKGTHKGYNYVLCFDASVQEKRSASPTGFAMYIPPDVSDQASQN